MKFQMTHQEPQIRTISCINGKEYSIALPPISLFQSNKKCRPTTYFRFHENFYHAFFALRTFLPANPESEDNTNSELFWNLPFTEIHNPFHVNSSLVISSFQQWHELTQQNPNFMQEQFNLEWNKCSPWFLYANQKTGVAEEFFGNLFGKSGGNLIAKFHQASTKSIRVHEGMKPFSWISTPNLALVKLTSNLDPSNITFLCLAHTRDNSYVPFYLPNTDFIGSVCMGYDAESFIEKYGHKFTFEDYFWNSSFYCCMSHKIHPNPNLSIESLQQWQELTQQNPNFFQQELDPNFMKRNSPILYNLRNNQLSWVLQ